MSLFVVLFIALIIGFLLIFATSLSGKRRPDGIGSMDDGSLPNYERFVRICRDIFENFKMDILEVNENTEDQSVDFYLENPKPVVGGKLLAHCILRNKDDVVGAGDIIELSNAIIQDRQSKGIFITTGKFTDELAAISELAPIEFIDGGRLEELAKEFKVPLIT